MLILGLLLRLHSLEEKQKVSKGSPAYGVSKGQAAYAVRLRGTLTDTNAGREKQSFFFSFLFTVFFRLLFPKYLQGYFNYSYVCFRVLRCYLPISYLSAQELQLPMNILNPSIMFDDFYGSAGDVTAYHLDGKCHIRKRSRPQFPASAAQKACLEVHRRAMAAWRTVPHEVQQQWNSYAEIVEPHRPPFDHSSHISGNNLFVSAYHGFATLGNEHTPEPMPFQPFPPFAVEYDRAVALNGKLNLSIKVTIHDEARRYRLLSRLQITTLGSGKNSGAMRNHLCDGCCSDKTVTVSLPLPDSECISLHGRFTIIDTITGYRSQWQQKSATLQII